MFFWDMDVGHALTLGDTAYIRVEQKSGPKVRLAISTELAPIEVIKHSVMPSRFNFNFGVTGKPRVASARILEAVA